MRGGSGSHEGIIDGNNKDLAGVLELGVGDVAGYVCGATAGA